MFTLLIILFQLFVHQAHGNNTRVNIEGCKTAVTLGYGYKTTYRIREVGQHSDNQLVFKFYVKTASDAHILLTTVESPTDPDDTPSYEIVFGGGRNSFSAIRSKGRDLPGAHVNTPNILSSEEYRGFWIKLSSQGRIEIGKAESNIPLLFWDDSHPISIRYVAFCSWASFVGQWAYSCPNDAQVDEMPQNVTTLERLRSELLTHYDPFNIPVIQMGDVTTVFFQLKSQSIKIDEKHSTMSIVAAVQLQWQDQKLQWDPRRNGNISKLTLMYHEIWLPYLTLYNSVGASTITLEHRPVNVSPLGSVKWKTQMNAEVHCNLDLSEWPYDRQTCELHLGFWTEDKYLKLLYNTESDKSPQQTNSEWQILNLEFENVRLKTPWMNVSDVPKDAVIAVRYVLQRNNYMYRAVFGVPLLVISIMTLLPFWISPMNPNKLHISCLSLIIMTIFVVSLGQTLPAPANHIPVLVKTYSRGMVAVAFSILISVAVITMARSTHIRPVPQIIQTLMSGKYVQLVLFFPAMSNKDAADYGSLVEGGSSNHLADCSNNSSNVNNIQEQWALLATIIDRVSFLIYVIYLSAVFLGQLSHM